MIKYRSICWCLIFLVTLNGCNELGEDVKTLKNIPEEEVKNSSDDKSGEQNKTAQEPDIEQEASSITTNDQNSKSDQSVKSDQSSNGSVTSDPIPNLGSVFLQNEDGKNPDIPIFDGNSSMFRINATEEPGYNPSLKKADDNTTEDYASPVELINSTTSDDELIFSDHAIEAPKQNISLEIPTISNKQEDFPIVEMINPEFIADTIVINFDVTFYELLNQAISTLGDTEYIKIKDLDNSENFLVSPSTMFTVASFLEFSAAGVSKTNIQKGLRWAAENNWPFSSWFYQIGNPFDEDESLLNNQAWGQTDYLFNKSYLSSISDTFFTDLVYVDYLELDKFIRSEELVSEEVTIDAPEQSIRLVDNGIYVGREELARAEIETGISETFLYDESILQTTLDSIQTKTRLTFTSSFAIDTLWSDDSSQISEIGGFWGAGEEKLKMPMLKWSGVFRRHDTENYRSVIIPLADQATSLTVIMPVDQSSFDLVEANMLNTLEEIEDSYQNVKMDFVLPHFSVQTKSEITEIIPDGEYIANVETTATRNKVRAYGSPVPYSATFTYDTSVIYRSTAINSTTPVKTSDYSTVNGTGFLKRGSLTGESYLNITTAGVKLESTAITSLNATEDEPIALISGNVDDGVGFSQITLSDVNGLTYFQTIIGGGSVIKDYNKFLTCDIVEEKKGSSQALPFIFAIKDLATGSILQLGRVTQLAGNIDVRDVCENEKIAYADNIWPKYPREKIVSTPHVNTSEYNEKIVSIGSAVDAEAIKQFIKEIYNPLAIEMYQKRGGDSYTVAPLTSKHIKGIVQSQAAGSNTFDVLKASVMNPELENPGLQAVNYFSELVNSKTWIESDYEVSENYLDTVVSLTNEFDVLDILHNPDDLSSDVAYWTDGVADAGILNNLVNNRTRLMFVSSLVHKQELATRSVTGTFMSDAELWTNVPMLEISGDYKTLKSDAYKAVEIPFVESNVDLLVIMPKKGKFAIVEEKLLDAISMFDNHSEQRLATFSLPYISLSQNRSNDTHQSSAHYRNVSELRPLVPRPQYDLSQFSISSEGVKLASYSLSSLVVPADNMVTNELDEDFRRVFSLSSDDPSDINYSSTNDPFSTAETTCNTSNNLMASVDARPFIFILRDRTNKAVMQIGRIKLPQSNVGLAKHCNPGTSDNENNFWSIGS